MEIRFSVDTKQRNTLLKVFPQEIRRARNRMLNDMAFSFKEIAPVVIAKMKTVRNEAFVKRQIQVEKATDSRPEAVVGSVSIENSSSQGAFSGWAEDYGEKPKERRAFRSIGKNARGGSCRARPNRGPGSKKEQALSTRTTYRAAGMETTALWQPSSMWRRRQERADSLS
jgi:hypothetical protein